MPAQWIGPTGLAHGAAVAGPHARGHEADRAAAGVALARPVLLDPPLRCAGPGPVQARQAREHGVAALVGAQALDRPSLAAADEREQDAGGAVRRAVVERRGRRAGVRDSLAVEPVGSPEGLVVDGDALDVGAPRHPLSQLRSRRGQLGLELDALAERRRHGHDRPPGGHPLPAGRDDHALLAPLDPRHGRPAAPRPRRAPPPCAARSAASPPRIGPAGRRPRRRSGG